MDTRKQELLNCLETMNEEKRKVAIKLIDEIVFQEELLEDLRKEVMVKRHPRNPQMIKPSPAFKMYRETEQLYALNIKTLVSMANKNEIKEKSPLGKYLEMISK